MALFNLLARSENQVNWLELHTAIDLKSLSFIYIFPIPNDLTEACDSLGITASGTSVEAIRKIKIELLLLLSILWENNFRIFELFNGKEVSSTNYSEVFNFF